MRRKVEALRENLDEFVQQDEYPLLAVGCLAEELAYVVKFLQALEETHGHCWFVTFPNAFTSASAYLDGVVENLQAQLAGAAEVRAQRGDPAFPPLPDSLADSRRPAELRLRGVLDYLRGLLPPPHDDPAAPEQRVVVGLLPLSCTDYKAWCELVNPLAIDPAMQPSLQRMRVVVWDDRSRNELIEFLRARKVEHVLTFEVDFSTPALTDALAADAADPSLPAMERMSNLLQLAALDYSYKRHTDALEKYGLLYRFYEGEKLAAMQAMCLLGTGDTLAAAGHPQPAKERLQQGIALAMESKALPVLVNLLLSIHGVCMTLRQFEEAESYAESGTKVAAAVLNPFVYADFHELQADALVARNEIAGGLKAYERCEELCEMYEYHHRWKSSLAKRRKIYEDARMRGEQREVDKKLALVEAMERRGSGARQGAPA